MKKNRTFIILSLGLLIAIGIILDRFVSIKTPVIRITFSYLPLAAGSIIAGPLWGAAAAGLSDIIGTLLFSSQGAYFPGFTLSAIVAGLIYGFLMYRKKPSVLRTLVAVLIVIIIVDCGLNTLWIGITTGKTAAALFIPRMTKNALMAPVQIILIYTMWRMISKIKLPGSK